MSGGEGVIYLSAMNGRVWCGKEECLSLGFFSEALVVERTRSTEFSLFMVYDTPYSKRCSYGFST